MKKRLCILSLILFFISCEKCGDGDPLEGEKSILVGKWNWEYTILEYHQFGSVNFDTIYNDDNSYQHQVKFTECGELFFFENDSLKKIYNVQFNHFTSESETEEKFGFNIYLNNNPEQKIFGIVRPLTFSMSGKFLPDYASKIDLVYFVNSYKKIN